MNPFDKSDLIAHRLAAWKPAPVVSGRDRILYEAGVATGRRQARWQMAAVLLPLLIGSGGWLWHERTEETRLKLALIEHPARSNPRPVQTSIAPLEKMASMPHPEPSSYLALSYPMMPTGLEQASPILAVPRPNTSTSGANRRAILTPFSSRNPHAVAEL